MIYPGPLHCPLVPEFPSCLHSPSPSPSLPYPTYGSLCLLPGRGALLWLQLFRCADVDPVWDRWSFLPHVDLPSSNSCTEVSKWSIMHVDTDAPSSCPTSTSRQTLDTYTPHPTHPHRHTLGTNTPFTYTHLQCIDFVFYTYRSTMVWAMGSLCVSHIYRMMTDYGGWHLDFTG